MPNLTLAGFESVSTNITEVTNSQPAQILPVICGSVRIVTSNIRDRQAGRHFLDCSGDFRASQKVLLSLGTHLIFQQQKYRRGLKE